MYSWRWKQDLRFRDSCHQLLGRTPCGLDRVRSVPAKSHPSVDWSFKRVKTFSIVKYGLIKDGNEFEIVERERKNCRRLLSAFAARHLPHLFEEGLQLAGFQTFVASKIIGFLWPA